MITDKTLSRARLPLILALNVALEIAWGTDTRNLDASPYENRSLRIRMHVRRARSTGFVFLRQGDGSCQLPFNRIFNIESVYSARRPDLPIVGCLDCWGPLSGYSCVFQRFSGACQHQGFP
jgi:hypothetical protein